MNVIKGYFSVGNTRMFGFKDKGSLIITDKQLIFETRKLKIEINFTDIEKIEHPKKRGIVFTLKNVINLEKIYTFSCLPDSGVFSTGFMAGGVIGGIGLGNLIGSFNRNRNISNNNLILFKLLNQILNL